jgi:hypothetical protein
MPKSPSPRPTAWGVLGIMASCFFGLMCFYHAVYWVWQAAAFHSNKHQAWTHLAIWLALAAAAALVWCRLVWIMYVPKKNKG